MIPQTVRRSFGLRGRAATLHGGTAAVLRVGDVVVKPIGPMSLETPDSLLLAPWLAEHLAVLPEDGFRIARPLPTKSGAWLSGGWSAFRFVEGRWAQPDDMPEVIEATAALHRAMAAVPAHPLLAHNHSPWGVAHQACLGERPRFVHPLLAEQVDALYDLRRPLPPQPEQLIHGDLNAGNILIAPGLPPAFIDVAPFWAPPELALGMLANWVGPRQGDTDVLRHFAGVPQFDQWLIRAAIRMLIVVSELRGVAGWEHSSERRAADLVLRYVA